MIRNSIENDCRVAIMDSANDLISRVDLPRNPGATNPRVRGDFVGRSFSSMENARDAARVLWAKGMEMLEEMRAELAKAVLPKPKCRKRRLKWDEANGDEVDNDRLRSGQDYWRTSHREFTTGPATRVIIVQIGGTGEHNSRDLLWRGAAAIALAEALENAGYRVEIYAITTGTHRYKVGVLDDMTALTLKEADEPLDPSTLINVTSGWFYRTVVFHHFAVTDAGHFGSTHPPKDWQLDKISTADDRIVISHCYNRDDALYAVRQVLAPLAEV